MPELLNLRYFRNFTTTQLFLSLFILFVVFIWYRIRPDRIHGMDRGDAPAVRNARHRLHQRGQHKREQHAPGEGGPNALPTDRRRCVQVFSFCFLYASNAYN